MSTDPSTPQFHNLDNTTDPAMQKPFREMAVPSSRRHHNTNNHPCIFDPQGQQPTWYLDGDQRRIPLYTHPYNGPYACPLTEPMMYEYGQRSSPLHLQANVRVYVGKHCVLVNRDWENKGGKHHVRRTYHCFSFETNLEVPLESSMCRTVHGFMTLGLPASHLVTILCEKTHDRLGAHLEVVVRPENFIYRNAMREDGYDIMCRNPPTIAEQIVLATVRDFPDQGYVKGMGKRQGEDGNYRYLRANQITGIDSLTWERAIQSCTGRGMLSLRKALTWVGKNCILSIPLDSLKLP